jgi:transposase
LSDPTIDATNWRAEPALRPAVATRNVCGGHRTPFAAQTPHILATLFRTSRQRAVDPLQILSGLLRERVPRLAAALPPT